MKKLILLFLILLSLTSNSCSTITTQPTSASTTLEQTQDVAIKSVVSLGTVLVTAPSMLKTARLSNLLTKTDYNNAVDIYNQALAAYNILNTSLQAVITAKEDPSKASTYLTALAAYLTKINALNDILKALKG